MSKVVKASLILMMATMISKVLGFGRELVLASYYGASSYSDIYITALNIPAVIFVAIGTAIGTTFIPIYFDVKKNGGEIKSKEFVNNVLNSIIIISIIIGILGFIFTQPLVKLFAVGFEGEKLATTIKFTKIIIWGITFISISNIMTAYLQTQNSFAIQGLIGIPYNIIIIVSIVLSTKFGIYILPVGALLAMMSQFLFQLPYARKKGYKYRPYINFKDENLKRMVYLVGPVFIGVAVNQINAIVDRTLASTLTEGSLSSLNYANKLNEFVMGMFITSISAVVYPMLSKLSTYDDNDNFISTIVKSVNSVILLVVPISVGAIVLANPVVKLLFERGAFDSNATSMTSIALIYYSIGMVAFGLRDILGKVFYSLKDTKTPMINGSISMIMNIIFNIIFIKFMGHAGLALGTSLAAIICVFLLFINLKKKIGYLGEDKIIRNSIKVITSSIIMGVSVYFSYNISSKSMGAGFIQEATSLIVSVSIGIIIYSIFIVLFKVDEINLIINKLNKKIVSNGQF